jgi:APA family basic amino acid/polyamine antiporter
MKLKPKLSYFDLTMIIISLVIGIGIFRVPSSIARSAETPFIFYTVWVVGGIIAACGALIFAEIGSRLPVAGGFYKIFSHCYHPALAFMFNWTQIIINGASAAVVGIIGAEYINPLLPAAFQGDAGIKITVCAIVLLLGTLNFLGIKMGARTQNVLSMVKIGMMLVFCSAIFFTSGHIVSSPSTDIIQSDWVKAIGLSLVPVFFSCGGYQQTVNFGADINDPQRNLPKAVFTAMAIIIFLYLSINIVYVNVLGFEGVKNSKLVAAELAKAFLGEIGFKVTAITIFISVCGFINASLLSSPRMYHAMADDGMLPAIFKKVNEKTQTQEFALSFFVAVIILSLFMLQTFDRILNYVMFMDSLGLAMAGGAIFILRKREKTLAIPYTGYRAMLFPVLPIIYIGFLLWVAYGALMADTQNALIGFGLFLSGFPLYYVIKHFNKKNHE